MRDQGVDEHVGGAGIEGQDLLWLGGAREHRYVGDASEVEGNAAQLRVAVEKIVCVRNQRRALSTEGHVRGTKIADGGDAGARGDH